MIEMGNWEGGFAITDAAVTDEAFNEAKDCMISEIEDKTNEELHEFLDDKNMEEFARMKRISVFAVSAALVYLLNARNPHGQPMW